MGLRRKIFVRLLRRGKCRGRMGAAAPLQPPAGKSVEIAPPAILEEVFLMAAEEVVERLGKEWELELEAFV